MISKRQSKIFLKFIMKYSTIRERYYTLLTNFTYFGGGWIRRIAKLKREGLEIYDGRNKIN